MLIGLRNSRISLSFFFFISNVGRTTSFSYFYTIFSCRNFLLLTSSNLFSASSANCFLFVCTAFSLLRFYYIFFRFYYFSFSILDNSSFFSAYSSCCCFYSISLKCFLCSSSNYWCNLNIFLMSFLCYCFGRRMAGCDGSSVVEST